MQNNDIGKCILMAASEDNFTLGNIPEWLLLEDSCKDIFVLEIIDYVYLTFLTVTTMTSC